MVVVAVLVKAVAADRIDVVGNWVEDRKIGSSVRCLSD